MKLKSDILETVYPDFLNFLLCNNQIIVNGNIITSLEVLGFDTYKELVTSVNTLEIGQYGFIKNRWGDINFNSQRFSFHEKLFVSLNSEMRFYIKNPTLWGLQDTGEDRDIFYTKDFLRNLILKKE